MKTARTRLNPTVIILKIDSLSLLKIFRALGHSFISLVAVSVAYDFGFWQALTCSVLGWIFLTFLSRLPFLRVERVDSLLWRISTGIDQELNSKEAVAQYMEEIQTQKVNEVEE